MGTDYSFLRWESDFATAKRNETPKICDNTLIYDTSIVLFPDSHYCQISNVPNGIAFDGDLVVKLVDCADNILATITDKCAAFEIIDKFGKQQIVFECNNVGIDFYFKPVYLKLIKTDVSSGVVFWSNPILITNYRSEEVTRFAYRHTDYFNGISYDRSDVYQSIGLRLWFDRPNSQDEVTEYYQITRKNTISLRALVKETSIYNIEPLSVFSFRRANMLFKNDEIYADGVRISNKVVINSTERLGNSSLIKTDPIEAFVNLNDTFIDGLQVIQPLTAIITLPIGLYTVASLPNEITVTFNNTIVSGVGTVIVKNSLGVVIGSFTESDAIFSNNGFTIASFGGLTLPIDIYTIEVSNGFIAGYGDFNWSFEVALGDYDSNDYNSNDYFTD